MIDRITDAGQCDYYEVIIKVIKQGLSDNWAYTIRWDPIFNYPGSMVGGVGST